MRASVITTLFALAASVSALRITSQSGSSNVTVDFSKDTSITWETVESDPKTVRLEIVNFNVNPPSTYVIADTVNTSDKKYTVKPLTAEDVKTGSAYQFRFIGKESTNTGIVAQSDQFAVTKVADKKEETKTTSSGSTPAQTSAPATTTSSTPNSAGKVGAWGVASLAVAGAFAALL